MIAKFIAKKLKLILPSALYMLVYRMHTKQRLAFSSLGSARIKVGGKLPSGNRSKVLFELSFFYTSVDALKSITDTVESVFSEDDLINIKSDKEIERHYAIYIPPSKFNIKISGLIKSGFRVSIKGVDKTKRWCDFYSSSVKKKEPISLYKKFCSASGANVFGEDVAVFLHLIMENNCGELVCPSSNSCFKNATPSVLKKPITRERLSHNPEFDFDVDVVFTWVDGDDPAWQERKSLYSTNTTEFPRSALSNSRFKSRDEIKYALRSVLMYAPWVRNIYLVTDNQVPDWFQKNEKVKIIDHAEIFTDSSFLPVFNSHAIESNLHRIKGLSENFLYFNDDCFLRRPVSKSDFFSAFGRQSKFFYSNTAYIPFETNRELLPVDFAAINNADLLEKITGYRPIRKFQHTPIALKRSVIEKLETELPEIFIENSKSRFRSFSDFSLLSAFIHHYGFFEGKSQPSSINYGYINLDEKLAGNRLQRLLLNDQNLSCFCVNDVDCDKDKEFFSEVMEAIYCQKSIAEK